MEEEEELDVYIPKDREVESQHTQKMAQQIQTAIMENLRQELRVGASLPEDAAKDLILQVPMTLVFHIKILLHAIWKMWVVNPILSFMF